MVIKSYCLNNGNPNTDKTSLFTLRQHEWKLARYCQCQSDFLLDHIHIHFEISVHVPFDGFGKIYFFIKMLFISHVNFHCRIYWVACGFMKQIFQFPQTDMKYSQHCGKLPPSILLPPRKIRWMVRSPSSESNLHSFSQAVSDNICSQFSCALFVLVWLCYEFPALSCGLFIHTLQDICFDYFLLIL